MYSTGTGTGTVKGEDMFTSGCLGLVSQWIIMQRQSRTDKKAALRQKKEFERRVDEIWRIARCRVDEIYEEYGGSPVFFIETRNRVDNIYCQAGEACERLYHLHKENL